MNALELAEKIGHAMACTGRNRSTVSAEFLKASSVDHEAFDRWALKIAETAYKEAGAMDRPGYHLCKSAAEASFWAPQCTELADIVTMAIGREFERQKAAALDEQFDLFTAEEEKRAGLNWLSALLAGGASKVPELGKLLAGAAVLGGGATGSLAWLANRAIQEDDTDIEAMKAKINTYRRLTEDIDNEIQLRNRDQVPV